MFSTFLALLAFGALASSAPALPATLSVTPDLQPTVTAKHIDFFMSLVFGSDPIDASRRRMIGFADTATVYFRGASDGDRKNLLKAIEEFNTLVGRRVYVMVPDSNAMVKVSVVKPEYYVDIVPSESKNLFTHFNYRWDGSGNITTATIVMKDNMPGNEKLRTLRRSLARAGGLPLASDFEKESMFYKSGTAAYQFEPMDKVALRMLGDNHDLRGKPQHEVRAALEARYLGASKPVVLSAETSALRERLRETGWTLADQSKLYLLDTSSTLWNPGGASVSIRAPRATATSSAFASKDVLAEPLHGDSLIVYGELRARGMKKAALFLNAFDADRKVVEGRTSRELKTAMNWSPFIVVLLVPQGATTVAFGPMIEGPGEVEVRGLKFEVRKSKTR